MTDIPQDLRAIADGMDDPYQAPITALMIRKAADTIEALRSENRDLRRAPTPMGVDVIRAYRERDEARAEVARLRDALRKIAACPCRTHHACQKVGMERLRCVTCIARAELGEETDG